MKSQRLKFNFNNTRLSCVRLSTQDNKKIKNITIKHLQWNFPNLKYFVDMRCDALKDYIKYQDNYIWRITKPVGEVALDIEIPINSNNYLFEIILDNINISNNDINEWELLMYITYQ